MISTDGMHFQPAPFAMNEGYGHDVRVQGANVRWLSLSVKISAAWRDEITLG